MKSRTALLLILSAQLLLTGCFTGVESTPRISTAEVRRMKANDPPELSFMNDVTGIRPSEWNIGKTFTILDDRIAKVAAVDGSSAAASLQGHRVQLSDIGQAIDITGEPIVSLRFTTDDGRRITWHADFSPDSMSRMQYLEVPFMVEDDLLTQCSERLADRTLWIMTNLWYDLADRSFSSMRYIPVQVTEVLPGNMVHPLKLVLRAPNGGEFRLFMSPSTGARSARKFHNLFSLTDPRLKYPDIKDSTWMLIQRGGLAEDMTRDECRLSLGTPVDIVKSASRGYMYEKWSYENGVYLIFEDGLLRRWRL